MEKVKTFVEIEEAIRRFKNGEMLIVVDDEDRENEGDFIISAEKASVQDINFMIKEGRGLVCIAISSECTNRLELAPMVANNTAIAVTDCENF